MNKWEAAIDSISMGIGEGMRFPLWPEFRVCRSPVELLQFAQSVIRFQALGKRRRCGQQTRAVNGAQNVVEDEYGGDAQAGIHQPSSAHQNAFLSPARKRK